MSRAPHAVPRVIAIDGPAASGKSTLGRRLAERLGYRFLDTGLLYRAFTLAALMEGIPAEEEAAARFARTLGLRAGDEREAHVYIEDRDVTDELHTTAIEEHVSAYSAIPQVRQVLLGIQRGFAERGGAILAGRDIGEVVLPDADLKFYLEASKATREQRRTGERGHTRESATAEALHQRDERDAPRTFRAGDAVPIDTTHLSLDQVLERAWEAIECFSD